ncbi:hypothetical protein [Undibacterium sp. Ji49W]|uniref:hypothetical protein n=1 Tax=Undibacterium sp. Ji49W TaxID=3413040 RepID=UPI003BF400F8
MADSFMKRVTNTSSSQTARGAMISMDIGAVTGAVIGVVIGAVIGAVIGLSNDSIKQ